VLRKMKTGWELWRIPKNRHICFYQIWKPEISFYWYES